LMGGVATASTLLGPAGFLEIMRAANSSLSGAPPSGNNPAGTNS